MAKQMSFNSRSARSMQLWVSYLFLSSSLTFGKTKIKYDNDNDTSSSQL